MAQALPKLFTYEEFIEWLPENTLKHYELHDGIIVEMPQPSGKHEKVTGFLAGEITVEYKRLKLPYFIPKTALVKPPRKSSGYSPDVVLINDANLQNEEFWEKESTVTQSESIPLIIEVVSTNWEDDYYTKLGNYEAMKIPEYWIVDYAALGARKFIGNPKQPTISIYHLVDEEYQVAQFRNWEGIISPTFPDLKLTANQIFNAAL
ncbi:MAG: Uma2 family endonuclease [Nostoc sp. NOS(2021)]|uniref:Uma2 family endonuclease n=1 Tax=Nostoc sp. NOS(2021) TaxID=2815407 RepID=UPI0025E9FFC2|nr:Uma2 family endonuclease [Nostoc sp. NOS(2021)]MBN3898005.1 Uma2 family endonuclease [Nostoc sp. NOS(2021)]